MIPAQHDALDALSDLQRSLRAALMSPASERRVADQIAGRSVDALTVADLRQIITAAQECTP